VVCQNGINNIEILGYVKFGNIQFVVILGSQWIQRVQPIDFIDGFLKIHFFKLGLTQGRWNLGLFLINQEILAVSLEAVIIVELEPEVFTVQFLCQFFSAFLGCS